MITEADRRAAREIVFHAVYMLELHDCDDSRLQVAEAIAQAMQPERARAEAIEKAADGLAVELEALRNGIDCFCPEDYDMGEHSPSCVDINKALTAYEQAKEGK